MNPREPLFRKIDCLQIPVTDLDEGLAFYRDRLGHDLIWRTSTSAGLRMPGTDAEIVIQTEREGSETDLLVKSVDEAAQRFANAGGRVVVRPFDIPIGRCAVVEDPWGNRLVLLDASKGHLETDANGNVLLDAVDRPMVSDIGTRNWTVLVIGGGAAAGKTTAARAVAERHGASVVPVDAIWLGVKAATNPDSHPAFHYFDPSDEELDRLTPEALCERHIASAQVISRALDAVIEHLCWEGQPVVLEGAWITPDAVNRWTNQYKEVQGVFIHEPVADKVLAAMIERSHRQSPTNRQRVLSEVCWMFGNWVRDQGLAEGLPVLESRPRATLVERMLAVANS